MSKVELSVGGMTCQGCVRSIEMKLCGVRGVDYAHVNLGAGHITVTASTLSDLEKSNRGGTPESPGVRQ